MSIAVTSYLRNVLHLDAVVSGAAGLLMLAGAGILGPLLELPVGLLRWAGVALIPFVVLLVLVARRETTSRLLLFDIIAINALWVAGSFAILLSGAVSPNLLGTAFVVAQALAVALFAALQFSALRRAAQAVSA
jgi:hypothetical protein